MLSFMVLALVVKSTFSFTPGYYFCDNSIVQHHNGAIDAPQTAVLQLGNYLLDGAVTGRRWEAGSGARIADDVLLKIVAEDALLTMQLDECSLPSPS